MMTDALLQLATAQAVTVTAVSTNTIDLSQNRDLGPGEQLFLNITTDVAATAAGAATVNFQAISSAAANLSAPTVLAQSDAIGKAELVIGKCISIPIPPSVLAAQKTGQRYLGAQFTVGTGPLTAGSFTATISEHPLHEAVKNYPSGFVVA